MKCAQQNASVHFTSGCCSQCCISHQQPLLFHDVDDSFLSAFRRVVMQVVCVRGFWAGKTPCQKMPIHHVSLLTQRCPCLLCWFASWRQTLRCCSYCACHCSAVYSAQQNTLVVPRYRLHDHIRPSSIFCCASHSVEQSSCRIQRLDNQRCLLPTAFKDSSVRTTASAP